MMKTNGLVHGTANDVANARRGERLQPLMITLPHVGDGGFKEEWNSRVSVHRRSSQTIDEFPAKPLAI